jgi:hypothetical protein
MDVFDIVLKKSADVHVKHTSLQLTSAGFSITISNTLTASTDFSRFFHDYVKHTPLQLTSAGFSMTWKNLLKSVEAMGVFDIVLKKSADVRRSDGCV